MATHILRRGLAGGKPLPAHLRQHFLTPTPPAVSMIVGNPFWKYPLAQIPPEPAAAPLIAAIRELPERPFRIISHDAEDGRVFNASFFDDEATMRAFLAWYGENALAPGSQFHGALADAAAEDKPDSTASLLFGAGNGVLADTRFGEYQLGMAVRYSHGVLRDEAAREAATTEGVSGEFEQRIAECMQAEGVQYFGRLVMNGDVAGGAGSLLTASRYGSLDDARRGTEAVNALCGQEISEWFSARESIIGTASRVLEL